MSHNQTSPENQNNQHSKELEPQEPVTTQFLKFGKELFKSLHTDQLEVSLQVEQPEERTQFTAPDGTILLLRHTLGTIQPDGVEEQDVYSLVNIDEELNSRDVFTVSDDPLASEPLFTYNSDPLHSTPETRAASHMLELVAPDAHQEYGQFGLQQSMHYLEAAPVTAWAKPTIAPALM